VDRGVTAEETSGKWSAILSWLERQSELAAPKRVLQWLASPTLQVLSPLLLPLLSLIFPSMAFAQTFLPHTQFSTNPSSLQQALVAALVPHAAAPSWLLLGCGTGVPTVAALKMGVAKVGYLRKATALNQPPKNLKSAKSTNLTSLANPA
jgi:hypothetical protein